MSDSFLRVQKRKYEKAVQTCKELIARLEMNKNEFTKLLKVAQDGKFKDQEKTFELRIGALEEQINSLKEYQGKFEETINKIRSMQGRKMSNTKASDLLNNYKTLENVDKSYKNLQDNINLYIRTAKSINRVHKILRSSAASSENRISKILSSSATSKNKNNNNNNNFGTPAPFFPTFSNMFSSNRSRKNKKKGGKRRQTRKSK